MAYRVFTPQELEEMGELTLDLLNKAIEGNDTERAKKLAKKMYREFSTTHDILVDWIASFMDYTYKKYGEDGFYEALKNSVEGMSGQKIDYKAIEFKHRVMGIATVLKGHLQPMEVEEDDEKVCITMKPCGSGQRLVERGGYGSRYNFSMLTKPHDMTWNMADFPIYCTHCPMLEIVPMEQLGYPPYAIFPPDKVAGDGQCKLCVYKDIDDTPEEVFTRVGKKKSK